MDRFPRVAVVLALAVGLLATGATAGVGVVGDPVDTATETTPSAGTTTTADATPTAAPGGTDDPAAESVGPFRAVPVANETPNRLDLGGGRVESELASPAPDLGASLSAGDGEFKSAYVAYLARERLADAESDERRVALLRETLSLIEDRVESLRGREATAVAAYHNGSIDSRELLRRLGSIDAEAGALRAALTDIEQRNLDIITPFSFRFTTLELDLQSLEGPVRDRAGRALRANADPPRVQVAASAQGVTLEMVDEGLYTREAVRFDNYAPDGPLEYTLSGTTERLATLYPHSYDSAALTPVADRLFQVRWPHRQGTGTTVLYFDRTTGEVYREVQRLRLSQLPNSSVAVSAREEFRLVVSRTDGVDGVYRVNVYNATSDEGRDVAVTLDGETIGRTGDDGVLWTLRTEQSFNVSTTVEGFRLNVSVGGSG